METPFPRATLTLISQEQVSCTSPSSAASTAAVHDLEELFLLAFPSSFERRLRLVPSPADEKLATES